MLTERENNSIQVTNELWRTQFLMNKWCHEHLDGKVTASESLIGMWFKFQNRSDMIAFKIEWG